MVGFDATKNELAKKPIAKGEGQTNFASLSFTPIESQTRPRCILDLLHADCWMLH